MRLIGRAKLASLSERDRETAKWVASWIAELREANWRRPADVGRRFPKASEQNDGTILFPVPKHRVGIQVLIGFSYNVVLITSVKDVESANGN